MKILILANSDVGLYKFRKELLERLLREHEVTIALPDGEFIGAMVDLGCRFVEIPFDRRGLNPFKDLRLLARFLSVISAEQPDVILTFTIKPTIYGGIAARLKKIPYISNITGLGTAIENPGPLRGILLKLYKIALKKASAVLFQNQANLAFFRAQGILRADTNCCLIPGSGVNLQDHAFQPYPEYPPFQDRFLFIGRLMKDKGIEELFSAAATLKADYPEISFDIVGGCDEDYTERIAALEQQGILHYWGQQSDVRPFLQRCSAIVLPSYHEGMANVLLEAAATGRPVLASSIPGCAETFTEGVSGFGFPPKDEAALCQAMDAFLQLSPAQKKSFGSAGRKKMEAEFDRTRVVDAYLTAIRQIKH